MKIFNVNQIRTWDAYTIKHEPVSSIDLMERAASLCFEKIRDRFAFNNFGILCGPGNNGGDGLVIARLLIENDIDVEVIIPEISKNYSNDFSKNIDRLPRNVVKHINHTKEVNFNDYDCVIDAVFGSGLARPLEGLVADLVNNLNNHDVYIISVDIPSGLYADLNSYPVPDVYVKADVTYTFQLKKSSFFNEEVRSRIGMIEVVDIGLLEDFSTKEATDIYEIDEESIALKERDRFTHKFDYGFALIVGGARGTIGAPILSAKAAMRTGAGLVSVAVPEEGRSIVHQSMNELMLSESKGGSYLESIEIPEKVNAIGIGPGMNTNEETVKVLEQVFESGRPLVIDADGLNLISIYPELWKKLPEESIITPHFGEFQRLFGAIENGQSKYDILKEKAREHRIYIVLKGAITSIASPDGDLYFLDEVGNSGLATAGSGDVLTGIITSLLAQGYTSMEAAAFGVYIHAFAGDLSLEDNDVRSVVAGDFIEQIGQAIKNLTE